MPTLHSAGPGRMPPSMQPPLVSSVVLVTTLHSPILVTELVKLTLRDDFGQHQPIINILL